MSTKGSYQRGVILGLTLAEITMLIIFILLILLASLLKQTQEDKDEMELLRKENPDSAELVNEWQELVEELDLPAEPEVARQQLVEQNAELGEWRELVIVLGLPAKPEAAEQVLTEQKAALEIYQEMTQAQGLPPDPKAAKQALDEQKAALEAYQEMAQAQGLPPDPKAATQALNEQKAALDEWQAVARQYDLPPEPSAVSSALDKNKKPLQEIQRLTNQLQNLQRRFGKSGGGTDKPACLATSDGKPEYLFKVALRADGIALRATDITRRESSQGTIPLGGIEYDRTLSANEFLATTRALFEWGETQTIECRFFVKVYDETPEDKKELFKQLLQTVEQNFYKYLVQDANEQFTD